MEVWLEVWSIKNIAKTTVYVLSNTLPQCLHWQFGLSFFKEIVFLFLFKPEYWSNTTAILVYDLF